MNLRNTEDIVEEYKKRLEKFKESDQLKKLYELRQKVASEIDARLRDFRSPKELITEAFETKSTLKKYKEGFFHYLTHARLRHLASMPFIYGMIIPAAILHITLEIYQQICFRLYRIPLVKSKDYFIFDRMHLGYLNWFEKFNCAYCSYFNGLMGYGTEIAGRTEKYWCPIKHARRRAQTHAHYDNFFEYLDAKGYRDNIEAERRGDIDESQKCFQ